MLEDFVDERYASWNHRGAQAMLNGEPTLEQVAQWVASENINPEPKSGRQEMLENIVNCYV